MRIQHPRLNERSVSSPRSSPCWARSSRRPSWSWLMIRDGSNMPTQTAENAPIDSRFKEFIHYSELKQLAFKIEALQQEKAFRSLAVLSCLAGEGKTLFCAALAMAYVQTRRTSVLVIDTTTHQSEGSLVLKQCLGPSLPLVEEVSLEELRKGSD